MSWKCKPNKNESEDDFLHKNKFTKMDSLITVIMC